MDAAAWLIDAWGQIYPIAARCSIGRDQQSNDLIISDLAVSADHAELRHDQGRWILRDHGSANGSGLGGRSRSRTATPTHRAQVWFGVVSFYLWADPEPPAREVAPPDVRTLIPEIPVFHLSAEDSGALLIVRAVGGHPSHNAPGELAYRAHRDDRVRRAALPRLQFQLLRALCEAAIEAEDEGGACVRSHELLARLPFQTNRPEANHVRQVVSTLRAALARIGVPGGSSAGPDGMIHAGEGLGYRVTWRVSRAGQRPR